MSNVDRAITLFQNGHACSQAILMAWAPDFGLDASQAARLAAAFAGGMRQGSVCGAATGAFMVLGLAMCHEDCITREGRATVAAAAMAFGERFRERLGVINCPDILGCDLRTPEGFALAQGRGWFAEKCAPAIRAAAEILEEMVPSRRG